MSGVRSYAAANGAQKRAIVHIHIPKTGGTTIWDGLSQRFALSDTAPLTTPAEFENVDLDRYGLVSGLYVVEHLHRFSLPPFVITCLREPIDRAISNYDFIRAMYEQLVSAVRSDPVWEPMVRLSEAARRYSLRELIEHEPEMAASMFSDFQAKALSDPATVDSLGLAESAVRVLRKCDVVLLTDRLNASFEWLGQRLGCGPMQPMHSNISRDRTGRNLIEPSTRAALTEMNAADLKVYAVACDLHERQLRTWQEAGGRAEATLGWDAPPSASHFRFDQAIHGDGWEPRAKAKAGWCCWIGATGRAWIDLTAPEPTDCRLVCDIRAWITDAILKSAELTVNDQPVAHTSTRVRDGSFRFEAHVPQSAMRRRQGTVRLGFSVSHTARLSDIHPSSRDTRKLGILVGDIRLTPRASGASS